jgi:hypothetical protein
MQSSSRKTRGHGDVEDTITLKWIIKQ